MGKASPWSVRVSLHRTCWSGSKNLAAERCDRGEVVVSGGAKGVDLAAITGALDAGGQAIAILPNDLGKVAIAKSFRQHILNGDLLLLSSTSPKHPSRCGAPWNATNTFMPWLNKP